MMLMLARYCLRMFVLDILSERLYTAIAAEKQPAIIKITLIRPPVCAETGFRLSRQENTPCKKSILLEDVALKAKCV